MRVCEVEAGAGTRRRVMKNHLNDIILHERWWKGTIFGSARNRLKSTIRKLDAQRLWLKNFRITIKIKIWSLKLWILQVRVPESCWHHSSDPLLRDDAFDKILELITRSTLTHKPHLHFFATHVFQNFWQKRIKRSDRFCSKRGDESVHFLIGIFEMILVVLLDRHALKLLIDSLQIRQFRGKKVEKQTENCF